MSADELVRLVVADGWAVFVDGEQHNGGTEVDVPADLAEHWTERGWAHPAPAKRRRQTAR